MGGRLDKGERTDSTLYFLKETGTSTHGFGVDFGDIPR
jgi:hypothetical protein